MRLIDQSILPGRDEVIGLAKETSTPELLALLAMAVRVRKTKTALAALLALADRSVLPPDATSLALLPQLTDWRAFALATVVLGNRARGALSSLEEQGSLTPLQSHVGLYVRARVRTRGAGPRELLLGDAVLQHFSEEDPSFDPAISAALKELLDHVFSRPIAAWLPLDRNAPTSGVAERPDAGG